MGFDLDALRVALAEHDRVARVVIAAIKGSSPREVGAAMLVWADGQSGTIGGGALEFDAARDARRLETGPVLSQHALGPDLGQCCGGVVTLLTEVYDTDAMETLQGDLIARPVGARTEMPLDVSRMLAQARSQGQRIAPQLLDGWMIEPVHRPARDVWIWGAGHVGRAITGVLAPLPEIAITWVDTGAERFPATIPANVTVVPAANPADLVRHAPVNAEHLIVTYSHALDLELCHQLLNRGFAFAGLIGSATKWARFRSRLAALGHAPGRISAIACPIGDPALGKHPQAIAVGVAAALLQVSKANSSKKDLSA